jgi:hypothetical protein
MAHMHNLEDLLRRVIKRKAPANRLKNIRIDEVSLVDRGANQHANIALFKRDTGSSKDEVISEFVEFIRLFPESALQKILANATSEEPEDIEKRRNDRSLKPRVDYEDPAVINRRRLPVTGMTLAAQTVTGQPNPDRYIYKSEAMNTESIDRDLAVEALTSALEKQAARTECRNDAVLISLAKRTSEDGARIMSKAEWHATITAKSDGLRRAGESSAQAYAHFIDTREGRTLFAAYSVEAQRELAATDPTVAAIFPANMAKSEYPAKTVMSVQRGAQTLTNAVEDFMRESPQLVAMGREGRKRALQAVVASPDGRDPAILRSALAELEAMAAADAARDGGKQLQQDALA